MTCVFRTVRAAANTTLHSSQDFTSAGLTDIVGALFFVTATTTAGAPSTANTVIGMGVVDMNGNQVADCFSTQHGQSVTKVWQHKVGDACVLMADASTGTLYSAGFVGFITNGVQISWIVAPPTGYTITCVLIAGTDVLTSAGTQDFSGGDTSFPVDGSFSFTDLLFCFGNEGATGSALDGTADNVSGSFSFGAALQDRGTQTISSQFCAAVGLRNSKAAATENTMSGYFDDRIWAGVPTGADFDASVEVSGTDNGGQEDHGQPSGADSNLSYLAIQIDNHAITLDQRQPRSSPQSDTFPLVGSTVNPLTLAMFVGSRLTASGTDVGAAGMSIGAAGSATTQSSVDISFEKGTTTIAHCLNDTIVTHLQRPQGDETDVLTATITSMAASGIVLNETAVPATATFWWYVGIEGESTGVTGTGALTLAKMTGAAAGKEKFVASGALTLAKATSSAAALEKFVATASGTLQRATLVATALEKFVATGSATLQKVASAAAGLEKFIATAALTLQKMTASATGVEEIVEAQANLTLAKMIASAAALEKFVATESGTLQHVTSAGTGTVANPTTGTASLTLQRAQASAAALEKFVASSAGTLGKVSTTGAGTLAYRAQGSCTLHAAIAAATALEKFIASGALTLQRVQGSAAAREKIIGTASLTLAKVRLFATDQVPLTCAVDLDGSFSSIAVLDGSYNSEVELAGSFDSVANLKGSIC